MLPPLVHRDRIDLDRGRALAGLLNLDPELVRMGEVLRPGWQVAYLLPRPAQRDLGDDGHPRTDSGQGVRRMFAGGRLTLRPGLRFGSDVFARDEVVSTRETSGRGGRSMVFVTTRSTITSEGVACLVDERDVVYVEAGFGGLAAAAVNPAPRPGSTEVDVDPTLLFRFSALTYNAHRIHYDVDYARNVEGYPGLVVHGPLQALLMAEAATKALVGPLGAVLPGEASFDYQLVAPLFLGQGLLIGTHDRSGDEVAVEVIDRAGRVTARGRLALGGR